MSSDKEQQPLLGRRIAVPETRQLDVLTGLLQRRGAEVFRCPLVSIHDTEQSESVLQWLQLMIEQPFDDLILLTGEGLRRLRGFAARAHCDNDFMQALAQSRTIVRGPKPAKVLREYGLKPGMSAQTPTTAGVIQSLRNESLIGRRIGLQLYGQEPNLPLQDFLNEAGAQVFAVAPYRYADEAEAEQVENLVRRLIERQLDAICFTSTPQIARLIRVAKSMGRVDELLQALHETTIAAVGPVVADELQQQGLKADLMPDGSFFMKPLVQALVDYWR